MSRSENQLGRQLFYKMLGATLWICVIQDLFDGVWRVHRGEVFAWRYSGVLPLLPVPYLILEWGVLIASGFFLLWGRHRLAAIRWANPFVFLALTQSFSNQRTLVAIVLLYLATASSLESPWVYVMIRYQLLIVYTFSALSKIQMSFWNGDTLLALGHQVRGSLAPGFVLRILFSPSGAQVMAWLSLGAEILLPVLLIRRPRWGFWGVVLLHLGFSIVMPGLWPFTFVMVTIATLFLEKSNGAGCRTRVAPACAGKRD